MDGTERLHARLVDAYRRYERAYELARPGNVHEVDLVRARIDLILLLQTEGDSLPPEVLAQLAADATKLVSVSAPLPESTG